MAPEKSFFRQIDEIFQNLPTWLFEEVSGLIILVTKVTILTAVDTKLVNQSKS